MSTTVILKCDRCGDSWDKSERQDAGGNKRQLFALSLLQKELASPYYGSTSPHFTVEWCRPCIDKFQVLWPREPKTPADPPLQTPSERLESLLREIVREETADAVREVSQ